MATPTATAFVAATAARAFRVSAPAGAAAARRRPRPVTMPGAAPPAGRRRPQRGQAAMASSAVAPPSQPLSDAPPVDPVQYVVVRADLAAPPHGWPAGALMAQAVHAALAAAVAYADHPVTAAYTAQRGGAHLPGSLAPPSPPPSPPSSATSLAGGDPDAADTAAAPQMHTVVLAAKGEAALEGLAAKLEAAALDFVLWREQPEGVATALATRPYPRAEVRQHFRKLRLFSAPASPAAAAAAAPRPNGGG